MTGSDVDGVAKHDADHFMKCPGRGQWFDMRDLGQVIEHVHDAEIEISEGLAPPDGAAGLFNHDHGLRHAAAAPLVCPLDSELLGYVGIAVQAEQTPRFLLPNNLDPQNLIFAQDRVQPGTLYLVRNPLDVLWAAENGVENVVSFFADITPQNLETLAALCDQKRCDTIELF